MSQRFDFEFRQNPDRPPRPREKAGTMKILVMGNLSGRDDGQSNTPADPLSERTIHHIDIDDLDPVIRRIAPTLTLDLDNGQSIEFAINEIDDFHPDRLFHKLPAFKALRELRAKLHDAATYQDATAQLRQLTIADDLPAGDQSDTPTASPAPMEDDGMTLERLLGKPLSGHPHTDTKQTPAISRLIEQIVGEHVTPAADPNRELYFDAADELIGDLMRRMLHHPRFQALEALWRSVHFLISRLELDEELQLFVLDATKEELIADLHRSDNRPEQTALFQRLVENGVQMPGTAPWSLLVGNFRFGPSEGDIRLLSALGTLASQAGGPFLAEAHPTVLGCDSLADTPGPKDWDKLDPESERRWQALRESPAAQWIGLALPRLLLRLPYGADTDEIDDFNFSEISDPREHNRFLWGNPAFGCALLIGQTFKQRGWDTDAGEHLDIEDLPAYSYRQDEEWQLKPCAEAWLSEKAAETILASGLIPLLSIRNSNRIKVLSLPSLSDPVCALVTEWK